MRARLFFLLGYMIAGPNALVAEGKDVTDSMEQVDQRVSAKSDIGVQSNALGVVVDVDTKAPTVNDLKLMSDESYVNMEMSENGTGSRNGHVGLERAWMEAHDGVNVTTIEAVSLTNVDESNDWTARVPLSGLPNGIYELHFYAKDKFGNTSEPFKISAYNKKDSDPAGDIHADGIRVSE